jgi:hypothetical protein
VNVFIFLGPTLSRDDASTILGATYLPPAAQGDVFRAAKERPFAIGIIDGYFERLPAVWHKEILWALSRGIHVFGAASMGALRAAELAAFGMHGVGEIFQAFRNGVLEDDDEVAVAHGDASSGYRATSEAMVNIRATLRHAERSGVLASSIRERLETLAKSMFYPDRSYPRLLAHAVERGMHEDLTALRPFLISNRVDQKRADAVALLDAVRDCCGEAQAPKASAFSFVHTETWDQVVDWAETQPPFGPQSDKVPADLLAAEVRLSGPHGRALLAGGWNRIAAEILARRNGIAHHQELATAIDRGLRDAFEAMTDESGAEKIDGFEPWLEERGLTPESYRNFVERQADLTWLRERYRDEVDRHVVDELRLTGDYGRLSRRATHKQNVLAARGLDDPTLDDAGLDAPALLSWYFEKRIGRPLPSDLPAFLAEIGVRDTRALEREALRELLYSRLSTRAET